MEPEEREIRAVHSAWIAAVDAGDLDRLLALMTPDAVFLSPGRQPSGREEFAADFPAAHREFRIRCRSEPSEVVVVGEVAWTWSRDDLSVTPRAGGPPTRLAGHRMTVYRKQADGRWRLARDAHTLVPVAEPESREDG